MDNQLEIEIKDLTKVYKMGDIEVHALRGVSIDIRKGEFVAIMGHSGSGKSTLMNILGCLDTPTTGTYKLSGQDVSTLDSDTLAKIRNTALGFVFQNFNLLARSTALENVELPLLYNNMQQKERRHLAREALTTVGLEDRLSHLPTQLSGGQQQRVAIARAIVNNPSTLLADEPTGNLDTTTSAEIMNILKELAAQGKTILIITHEDDISKHAQRIITLRDGEIISQN